ncbi:pseudouridine synthase [Parvimonas micra]|uniref:pseudouridine synthase n=1 Tax=Parvimonas micra TaxID=33033 RepID=UPI0004A79FF7|nr:pseudouridine synthase [Parvimonas micra]
MKIRIDRFLCHMGIGSRSEIKKFLKTCRVKLNGKFEKSPNTQVDIEKDEILFDDEIVLYKEFTYLMLNKPKDYISATFDTKLPTVLDLLEFPYSNMELFPVGRLDIDTTGFLILTNDGKFSYNVTNPKKKVNKKYFVILKNDITSEQIESLENGIYFEKEDFTTENAKVEEISKREIYLTISEGKFHQVKRMLEYVGNEVVELKRISIGNLDLDKNLELGEYQEITDSEIEEIFR